MTTPKDIINSIHQQTMWGGEDTVTLATTRTSWAIFITTSEILPIKTNQ